MRRRGGGLARAAALAVAGAVAVAPGAGALAGAAARVPAAAPAAVALTVTIAGRPAAAVRLDRVTVLIAAAADKGGAVTLGALPPLPAAAMPAAGRAVPSAPVAGGPVRPGATGAAGAILARGDGFSVARLPAEALDAAGAPIVPLSATAMDFDDPLTLAAPRAAREAAALQGAAIVPWWPRRAVQISGLRPAAGGIVLNGCGQVAGIVGRDGAGGFAAAATRSAIAAGLAAAERPATAPVPACAARGHGIDRLIARARANAAALRAEAAGLDAQAAALAPRGPAAASRGAALRAQAATCRAAAAADLATADRLTAFAASHRRGRVAMVIGLIAPLLIAAIGALFWRRNRLLAGAQAREQARLDAQADALARQLAIRPWRDVVLAGGRDFLKVPGDLLGEGGAGAVIGRSAALARVTLSARDIGRAHARLFVAQDRLWLEDLGSVNGTCVNGARLRRGEPVPVAPGDEVAFAAHRFRVRIQ